MDYNPFLKVKDTIFGAKDNFMILDEDDQSLAGEWFTYCGKYFFFTWNQIKWVRDSNKCFFEFFN